MNFWILMLNVFERRVFGIEGKSLNELWDLACRADDLACKYEIEKMAARK